MNVDRLFRNFRFVLIIFVSFCFVIFLAPPSNAAMPSIDSDFLYEPRPVPVAILPDIRDIEQAYDAIANIPASTEMRIPIPSENPRESIVAEGTINRETGQENSITAEGVRDMYQREVALRVRGSQTSFDPESQSALIASMDTSNIAQYERCVYVDAYGNVSDLCVVDLVIRDTVTNQRWILPDVYVDRFCYHVMVASTNGTWF
ncbi:MAG: hypothetical protein HC840_28870 [Leptolyngbyaceae cyanobacterium RM2_2_4]|nr:hypothetical protein [Leptolyngbyaceae cyanobacterium SM1_4_3]NJN90896.1 hypothetical protein [Leptolyngbyaceae cyanobacterium SL_5_14]NJO52747.1 hypothetical protein [Leptolyngbyaceae cyanobacterium RM2_2_4]